MRNLAWESTWVSYLKAATWASTRVSYLKDVTVNIYIIRMTHTTLQNVLICITVQNAENTENIQIPKTRNIRNALLHMPGLEHADHTDYALRHITYV